MMVTVTLNPAFDKALTVDELTPGALHRVSVGPVVPSGKGINVARVARAWGYPVTALAWAGEGSEEFGAFLTHCGVSHLLLPVTGRIRTNIKLYERRFGRMTELNEPGCAVGDEEIAALKQELKRIAAEADVVVFAGSLPPGAPAELYRDLAQLVTEAGARAVVDASGNALKSALSQPLFAIKPNRGEAEELFCSDVPKSDLDLVRKLVATGTEHVILTMGADGAVFAHGGQILRTYPPKIEVGNTAGAGDALLATYLVGTLSGWPRAECAVRATAAGACAARGIGTDLATPADVEALSAEVRCEELNV